MARFDLYLTYIQRILNSFSTYIQLISKHQPLPGLTELRLLHLEHNQLTGNRRSWIIFPVSFTVPLDLYDTCIPLIASKDISSSYGGNSGKRNAKVLSNQVDWNGYREIAGCEMRLLQGKVDELKQHPNGKVLSEVVEDLYKFVQSS